MLLSLSLHIQTPNHSKITQTKKLSPQTSQSYANLTFEVPDNPNSIMDAILFHTPRFLKDIIYFKKDVPLCRQPKNCFIIKSFLTETKNSFFSVQETVLFV